jgi:hypothetical protein
MLSNYPDVCRGICDLFVKGAFEELYYLYSLRLSISGGMIPRFCQLVFYPAEMYAADSQV